MQALSLLVMAACELPDYTSAFSGCFLAFRCLQSRMLKLGLLSYITERNLFFILAL